MGISRTTTIPGIDREERIGRFRGLFSNDDAGDD
jgi:hypothetical protein